MKGLAILVALVSASGLAVADDQPRVVKPTAINATAPFTESGTVEQVESQAWKQIEVNTVETGTKDAVAYRIYYTDGSASFAGEPGNTLAPGERGNWSVGCRKDAMTDARSCHVKKGDLWVWAYSTGVRRVIIGGDHYPGYAAQIRVDSQAPLSTPASGEGVFGPQGAKSAISQLLRGETVVTRYVDWPHRGNVDKTESLYGFKQAYEYMDWALANMR